MKTITVITAAGFMSLIALSILFKIMHWPGANVGLTIGIVGFAFFTIPSIGLHLLKSNKTIQ